LLAGVGILYSGTRACRNYNVQVVELSNFYGLARKMLSYRCDLSGKNQQCPNVSRHRN